MSKLPAMPHASVQAFPEAHRRECWATGCRAPGPYTDVPALAAHRWAAHGIEVADTYAVSDYRDEDEPGGRAPCGARMNVRFLGRHQAKCDACQASAPPSIAPCGKRVRSGPALGGHKGKCKACQLKMHPDGLRAGIAPPNPSKRLTPGEPMVRAPRVPLPKVRATARTKRTVGVSKSARRAESRTRVSVLAGPALMGKTTSALILSELDARIERLTKLRADLAEVLA